eukprot:gene7044-2627_t
MTVMMISSHASPAPWGTAFGWRAGRERHTAEEAELLAHLGFSVSAAREAWDDEC